jgi:hypothetical protein
MSDLSEKLAAIPEAAVEAVAKGIRDDDWPDHEDQIHHPVKDYMSNARAALEAAAAAGFGPVQAARAEALDDAADAADDPSREDMDTYFLDQSDVGRWLRARAVAERGEG